jgi:hypothetical protein
VNTDCLLLELTVKSNARFALDAASNTILSGSETMAYVMSIVHVCACSTEYDGGDEPSVLPTEAHVTPKSSVTCNSQDMELRPGYTLSQTGIPQRVVLAHCSCGPQWVQ